MPRFALWSNNIRFWTEVLAYAEFTSNWTLPKKMQIPCLTRNLNCASIDEGPR